MADTSSKNNPVQDPFQSDSDIQAAATPVAPTPVPPAGANKSSDEGGVKYEKEELAPEDLDARWTRWQCGVCNYTYEGSKPLKKCPRCGNEDPDKFLDAD